MRKALIGLFMAATAMTPVAARAQEDDGGRFERLQQRAERQQARSEQAQEARTERRAERSEQRTERRAERFEQRAERRAERQEAYQRPVQADQQLRAFSRRGERNLERAGISGGEQDRGQWQDRGEWRDGRRGRDRHDDHGHDHEVRRGDHRELHRDLNREHRDLHRSDPSRREHREWHRDANREHREVHRDTHRDLHTGGVTRREHRRYHREWDRHGWRNDRRYDWQRWRYSNRSLFRLDPYYSPYRGHRYSRFSIGLFLEPLFFNRRYWINDPFHYRLPPAPPGTQWVRYYNDVLLVDTWTGEVVDVIYDFFW